jgi:hypothetical protein
VCDLAPPRRNVTGLFIKENENEMLTKKSSRPRQSRLPARRTQGEADRAHALAKQSAGHRLHQRHGMAQDFRAEGPIGPCYFRDIGDSLASRGYLVRQPQLISLAFIGLVRSYPHSSPHCRL